MDHICAFPSKIHNLCRLNPTSAQVRKVILFDIVIGVVLLLTTFTTEFTTGFEEIVTGLY